MLRRLIQVVEDLEEALVEVEVVEVVEAHRLQSLIILRII
jgi:hypothetical protein